MRYVAFDLETTGVDPFRDVPVTAAFVERFNQGERIANNVVALTINPGRPIPEGASAVHGLYDADVENGADLDQAAIGLASRLEHYWREGGVVVGANVAYDLTMVDAIAQRAGRGPLEVGKVLDVLVIDRALDKWRRGSRKLAALHEHYLGRALDGAHGAAADALGALLVLEAQGKKWPFLTKMVHGDPTAQMARWHEIWLRNFSEYLANKGEEVPGPGRYAWPIHQDDSPRQVSGVDGFYPYSDVGSDLSLELRESGAPQSAETTL